MPSNYFDIKRDMAIVKADGFFCQTCLVGKPHSEQSPDPRYCQGCYDFLLKEAEMLPRNKRPAWIPKRKTAPKKQYQVSQVGGRNMSTLESKKVEVDIIPPSVSSVKASKRGPKHRRLPEALIKQLAGKGMGSKAIATRLSSEHGITVSYKTIQRLLAGEREQQALLI